MEDEEKDDLDEEEKDDEAEEESSESDSPKAEKDSKMALDKSAIYAISKIKAYLDDAASKDELFKAKYDPTDEKLAECWRYICGQVRSSKRECLQSDEMFGMAFEFFNDGLKPKDGDSYTKGKVMAENDKEDEELRSASCLTDEEKRQMKDKALKDFKEAQEKKLAKKEAKDKSKEAEKEKAEKERQAIAKAEKIKKDGGEQLSLF